MANKTFIVPYVASQHYFLWREFHVQRRDREPSDEAKAAHAAGHLGKQDVVTAASATAAAAIVQAKYPGHTVIIESIAGYAR